MKQTKLYTLLLFTILLFSSCESKRTYQFKDQSGTPISSMEINLTTSPDNQLNLRTDEKGFITIPNKFYEGQEAIFFTLKDGYKFWVKVKSEKRILQKSEENKTIKSSQQSIITNGSN